jgi:CMP/dCMP kinase
MLYIYSGAMYRALALACINEHISFKDEPRVRGLLDHTVIDIVPPQADSAYAYAVLLNGQDVSARIVQQDTAQGASDVGSLSSVRQWMVARQRELAKGKRVVMEGRDIALRVLPDAQLKIYLTASVEERAKRRYNQWQAKGVAKTFEETLADTRRRDMQDMTRETDPLQIVADAWELDTTTLSLEDVIKTIIEELKKRSLI